MPVSPRLRADIGPAPVLVTAKNEVTIAKIIHIEKTIIG